MKTDELISEMLGEIKSLKDLTKQELPLIAKEYIIVKKIYGWIWLGVGISLLGTGVAVAKYADSLFCKEARTILPILGIAVGFLLLSIRTAELIALYFQPRRMAIKAITSLKDDL